MTLAVYDGRFFEEPVVRPRPFPSFLEPAFSTDALEQPDTTIAVIDRDARILWVNPAWDRFARDNGASENLDALESYLDGISPPLRDFYRDVFDRALLTGNIFEHDYECSSPDKLRRFRLRVLPVEARGLVLEHSLLVEGPHTATAEPAIEARFLNPDGTILQCSNCRRVRAPDTSAWAWVPTWVAHAPPMTSHGICPSCVGFYWGMWCARRV
jgi:PAS domain-containing protein